MADLQNIQVTNLEKRRTARFEAQEFLDSYQDYITGKTSLETAWYHLLPACSFAYSWYPSLRYHLNAKEEVLNYVAIGLYEFIRKQQVPSGILPRSLSKYFGRVVRHLCLQAYTERFKGFAIPIQWRPEVAQWGSYKWAEDQVYIKELPALMEKRIVEGRVHDCAFKDTALYVARRLIKGEKVPLKLIKLRWNGNPTFLRDWVTVCIRRTMMERRVKDGDLLSAFKVARGIFFE